MRGLIGSCTKQVPDAAPAASRCRCTCSGHGTTDSWASVSARNASDRLGWPLHVVERAGHVPHIEQTESFLHALDDALDRSDERNGCELQTGLRDRVPSLERSSPITRRSLEKLLELVAREENGHEPPYGRALDIWKRQRVWGVQSARRAAGA